MTNDYSTDSIESIQKAEGVKVPSAKTLNILRQFARVCTVLPIAQATFMAN
ncbi:MAG: hypothetical protein J6C81_00340 [Muribaculaceae bacterium]|nr:hypothetical protein [Muribaculaceae bacterium]